MAEHEQLKEVKYCKPMVSKHTHISSSQQSLSELDTSAFGESHLPDDISLEVPSVLSERSTFHIIRAEQRLLQFNVPHTEEGHVEGTEISMSVVHKNNSMSSQVQGSI